MITYAMYTSFFTIAFIALSALLLMKIVNGIIDDKGHIQKDWKYYIITGIVVFCIFFLQLNLHMEKCCYGQDLKLIQ
jgi:drug/metabolite transporter (DMT)-like permease